MAKIIKIDTYRKLKALKAQEMALRRFVRKNETKRVLRGVK